MSQPRSGLEERRSACARGVPPVAGILHFEGERWYLEVWSSGQKTQIVPLALYDREATEEQVVAAAVVLDGLSHRTLVSILRERQVLFFVEPAQQELQEQSSGALQATPNETFIQPE